MIMLLVKHESQFDMAKLMKFCLTPIPYCMGTADGFLAKTKK